MDGGPSPRLVVKEGPRIHVIPVEKLDFVRVSGAVLELSVEGRVLRKFQTLASLIQYLDPKQFVRVHRSYVLNLDRLRTIELCSKGAHEAILADETRIPVSRRYYASLRLALNGHK